MKNAKISRRSFLLGLAACSAAGILTACKGDDTPASSASTSPEAPASSVSELEPIGLFTVEDFPKLDGSTACIPLMAQMMADTTGIDLEVARAAFRSAPRPMRGRTSASGPAATARTTAHSCSSSTRPPSTSRKSWPRPTQSSSRKPSAGTRWCSSSTKRIPSRA